MIRVFSDNNLCLDSVIVIHAPESHHMKVLRVSSGEQVEIVNGKGYLAVGNVVDIDKDNIKVAVTQVAFKEKDTQLTVVVPWLKCKKTFLYMIEKLCEIGVDCIIIYSAMNDSHSDHPCYDNGKLIKKIRCRMIAAIKQCKRVWIPNIAVIHSLDELEEHYTKEDIMYFGSLLSDAVPICEWYKRYDLIKKGHDNMCKIFFVSGQESGFTIKEICILKRLGFKGISLGNFVLRAENAPIVFAAIISPWSYIDY